MVGISGPSPKRRKTANGPVTADEIAQANSTAQLFSGQRMNRWMQGYVQAAEQVETSVPRPPAQPRQTANNSRSVSGTTSVQAERSQTRPPQNSIHTHTHTVSSAMSAAQAAATVGGPSRGSPTAPFPLVDYEFPAAATTAHARAMSSSAPYPPPKPTDQITRTASAASNPGLPSPVSSDGNINSPAMQYPYTFQTATPPPPQAGQPRVVRQRQSFYHGQPPPPPPPAYHQRLPSQPHAQPMAPPVLPSNATMNGQGPVHMQPHPNAYYPSHMHLNVMLAKLDAFRAALKRPNPIDSGRLLLLSEAVKTGDWFYIVLSQLHALSSSLTQLPTAAKNLPPAAFQTLSTLLSSNEAVTPVVLQWLGNFPASIVDLYSSMDNPQYNGEVQKVAKFLNTLPGQWQRLLAHCKQLEAPPLVEDMWDCLGLSSRVLQTTIFRTIARMIWETGSSIGTNQGVDQLERLHYYNQGAFYHVRRRNKEETEAAYTALQFALQAWRKFQAQQAQNGLNGRTANGGQLDPRTIFVLPEFIEKTFKEPPGLGNGQRLSVVAPNGAASASPVHASPNMPQPAPRRQPQNNPQTGRASPAQNGQMQSHSHPPPPHHQSSNPPPGTVPFLFAVPVQRHPPHPRLMFPHENETQQRAQPTEPDTTRSGLHQAHLRSPVLTSAPVANARSPKLYRHVLSGWAVSPVRVNENKPINTVPFEVTDEAHRRIPKSHPPKLPGGRHGHILDASSETYRLRCVAMPPTRFPSQKAWVETDTIWPEKLYFELNGNHLETRRKLHHGRYLPIDLTPYVRRGENVLKALVNRESTDKRPFSYAIAVEIVGVKTHDDILANVTRLSAADSLAAIKASLSDSNAAGSDDDIAVMSSNTIINLFDPFYGDRMVRTPVRGDGCLHRDCFDLETFLSTCKRETPDAPTKVDCWRCPICRGDVRPQTLVLDGFLVEVREALEKKAALGTRAVVVNADGSWVAKDEERTGVRSASLEKEEGVEGARKEVEIVELD